MGVRPLMESRAERTEQMSTERKAAADLEAAAIKRFLSRARGTVQQALIKIDVQETGLVDRDEWANGLERLGYQGHGDIQDAFTSLDKRSHHILTLSDFQAGGGNDVTEGRKPEGILELASDIFCDAISDLLNDVCSEVLRDCLVDAMLSPVQVPTVDVKEWLKKREKEQKAARQ